MFSCELRRIEPLYLENLRVLWISRNHLTSLSVLALHFSNFQIILMPMVTLIVGFINYSF